MRQASVGDPSCWVAPFQRGSHARGASSRLWLPLPLPPSTSGRPDWRKAARARAAPGREEANGAKLRGVVDPRAASSEWQVPRVGPWQVAGHHSTPGLRNAPRGPWLAAGALLPTSGSAHLSAGGASTFSFLGLGSSSAAAIFALPPYQGSTARPAPCPPHRLLFSEHRPLQTPPRAGHSAPPPLALPARPHSDGHAPSGAHPLSGTRG